MDPMGPEMMAVRAPERRDKLKEWRRRYSKSAYPSKVAQNIVLDGLVQEREHNTYEDSFGIKEADNIQKAIDKVRKREEGIMNRALSDAEKAYENREWIGNMEVEGLKDKVSSAESKDDVAVEELEYSYVYYGLMYELFTGWYAAGICGLGREEAMGVMTGHVVDDPSDLEAVEGLFGDYVGTVVQKTNIYEALPLLW